MPHTDSTSLLGRLLTQQQTRLNYQSASGATYDVQGLERQAQTLLHKRFSEIKKLISVSASRFDAADYRHFLDYAESYWPTGHRHHLLDALGFCEYLGRWESSKIDRREWNYLRFCADRKRFKIHLIRDGVQIIYQYGLHWPRQWKIYWRLRRSQSNWRNRLSGV